MRFALHRLLEGPEVLELGERIGSLSVAPVSVELEDAHLRERLERLLSEPLAVRTAVPDTLGTALVFVGVGDEGYAEALRARLERRDFRLVLSEE